MFPPDLDRDYTWMPRVEDKMWAIAVDKEEKLALVVFWRLAGSGCEPPNGTANTFCQFIQIKTERASKDFIKLE